MIGNHSRGIANRDEIRSILENCNSEKKKVLFAMNGHDHGDNIRLINGINYYTLNSASHVWQPKEIYKYERDVHNRFPYLKNYIMYKDALHIIVCVNDQMSVDIQGMESEYQKVMPEDVGLNRTWNNVSILPRTSSLHIAV
jgi:hypothetical protein